MDELARERHDLVMADNHIVEGERRISRQRALIERLRRDGHDSAAADRLLANLEQTLVGWNDHRHAILRRIAFLGQQSSDKARQTQSTR